MSPKFDWDDYDDAPAAAAPAAGASKFNWDDHPDAPDSPGALVQAGRSFMGGVAKVGRAIDTYTGAPARAAVYAAETSPTEMGRPMAGAQAFVNQFGQNPSNAPTGQDIADASGWFDKGSAASKVAGVATDLAVNPVNFLPVGAVIGEGAKGIGRVLGAASDAIPEVSPAANAAADAASIPAKKPGMIAKAAGGTAATFTGVDRNLAANYVANTDRINGIISDYAGPEGYAEADHAADIRSGWRSAIQSTRQALNDKISTALNAPGASEAGTISAAPVMDQLSAAFDKAHPVTQAADRTAIKGMQDMVDQMADANGDISLKDLHAVKMKLQDIAAPTYDGAGNAIFPQGKFAAQAAQGAAGAARQTLITDGPASVASAEASLSKLHTAEDTMNSTLLKDNGPVNAINRAGVNAGGTEARSLKQLSDITGHDFGQDAKDFATARTFAAPSFSPLDTTGKSVWRTGAAMAAGGVGGHILGIDPKLTAAGAGFLASPAMVKTGINATNIAGKAATIPIDMAKSAGAYGLSALASPGGKTAMDLGVKGLAASPAMAQGTSNIPPGSDIARSAGPNRTPSAGPDAWASQGIQKLGIQDAGLSSRLLADPKAKQLLIQASDLAPGSKAMKQIMSQIQKGWGQ